MEGAKWCRLATFKEPLLVTSGSKTVIAAVLLVHLARLVFLPGRMASAICTLRSITVLSMAHLIIMPVLNSCKAIQAAKRMHIFALKLEQLQVL